MSRRNKKGCSPKLGTGRNDLCPCGSGVKYKKCCGHASGSVSALHMPIVSPHWQIRNIRDLPPAERKCCEEMNRQILAEQFSGPRSVSAQHKGYTFRAIGNRLHYTPQHKSYLDFIYDLLKQSLGKTWWEQQTKLSADQRHVIRKWNTSWYESFRRQLPNPQQDRAYQVELTGNGRELFTLADDLYRLQLVRALPAKFMHRLRNRDGFQGARYEARVAAIMLRAGFEIEWADESQKHCEFYAIHQQTKIRVAVEAKSRRRAGTYHTPETTFPRNWSAADVEGLYREALAQNPGDRPFAVFIDVNLPPEPEKVTFQKQWIRNVLTMMEKLPKPSESNPDPVSMVVFTNYSWHFQGDRRAELGEAVCTFPLYTVHPIGDAATAEVIRNSVIGYGDLQENCPKQISEQTLSALLEKSLR